MKPAYFALILLSLLGSTPAPAVAQDDHHYQTGFSASEFVQRRQRIFDKIGGDAIAVVQGAGGVVDQSRFRQSNEFYYLTGLEIPFAYILMDGRSRTTTLYLPPEDKEREKSEGHIVSAADIDFLKNATGVQNVRAASFLSVDLAAAGLLRPPAPALYTPLSRAESVSRDELLLGQARVSADPWDGALPRETRFKQLLNARFPQFEVRDLSPILDAMRLVKSEQEIAVIRQATRIAGEAIMEAMRSTEPGVCEYQLDAASKYIFYLNGAQGEGYASIIAGGENSWFGHYFRKADRLVDGDMVLMDHAPDYRYYTSDVTRMWPVNGRYSAEQRELADYILAYRDALFRHVRPGVTSDYVLDRAAEDMKQYLADVRFTNPAHAAAARAGLEFRGHFQHSVGMSVHDVGTVRGVPLQPGMIFTIDPMIWLPEERLYVRIEDVALVTSGGVENLSAFVPSRRDEIEQTISEPGVVQFRPPLEK